MNVKGVSFSKYKVKVNTYVFEKLDLFAFLFTQIILDEKLDKEKKLIECLLDLDISEDLHYLFNNIYYKLIDNRVINDCYSEDINDLRLKDIVVNECFVSYLKDGYFPVLNGEVEKEFIYDYLLKRVVLEKDTYEDSNLCVVCVDNDRDSIEKIINDNKKSLFDIDEGLCILKDAIVDPYYFKINTDNLKEVNKDVVYKALIDNSLYLNDDIQKGEYLSSNIRFTCLYSSRDVASYCSYLFVNDKEREFEVDNNKIYINYNLEGDFVDLVNRYSYKVGRDILDNHYISTYKKDKIDISEFKLYLIKNKNKFTNSISKVIELI